MSQSFNANRPPLNTNGHISSSNVDSTYHPALPNFADFPGLTALTQSLSSQSQVALSTQTPTSAASTPIPQSYYSPQARGPSVKNSDLERLERLKKEILEGQNPIYKAIPQPNFLESLYLGRSLQINNSAPAHPDQLTADRKENIPQAPSTNDNKVSGPYHTASKTHFLPLGIRHNLHSYFKSKKGLNNADYFPLQNTGEIIDINRPDNVGPGRSSSLVLKTPQNGQSIALNSSSLDSAKLPYEKPIPSEQGRPTPTNQLYTDKRTNDETKASFVNNTLLAKDPPYDPKESLRRPGYQPSMGEKRVPDSRDSKNFDPRYGRVYDREKDVRDRRHDYRYDERRVFTDDRDFRDKRFSSGYDPKESRLSLEPRNQDAKYPLDDLRSASNLPDSQNKHPEEINRGTPPDSGIAHLSAASNDLNVTPPAIYSSTKSVHNGDLSRTSSINIQIKQEESPQVSSVDDVSKQSISTETFGTTQSQSSTLEKRIGNRVVPALEDRIGDRIPLEKRISTPPAVVSPQVSTLQDRIGERSLEERIGIKPIIATEVKPTIIEPSNKISSEKISIPLASVSTNVTPVQQRFGSHLSAGDSPVVRPDDRYSQRPVSYSSDYRASTIQTPSRPNEPDMRYHPNTHHDDRERKNITGGRPISDSAPGHYERPAIIDDRGRPTLDTREWRERDNHQLKSSIRHPESYPPPDGERYSSRPWAANERGYRTSEWGPHTPTSGLDADRGINRYAERRPAIPRSWDREEGRPRPPSEVYQPYQSDRVDPERYAADYRDPRLHGPGPNPSLQRRPNIDDLRPPAKRPREDVGYYDERDRRYPPPEYIAAAHPPPPSTAGSYYESRGPYPPYSDHYRERVTADYYDRRVPQEAGPPYTSGRPGYARPELDRYGAPPRTA